MVEGLRMRDYRNAGHAGGVAALHQNPERILGGVVCVIWDEKSPDFLTVDQPEL